MMREAQFKNFMRGRKTGLPLEMGELQWVFCCRAGYATEGLDLEEQRRGEDLWLASLFPGLEWPVCLQGLQSIDQTDYFCFFLSI